MPKATHFLEIANVICKFGDKAVMLDLFNEVIKPAFFEEDRMRKFSDTKYFFHKVAFTYLDLDKKHLGITGRLVKDTVLEQQQIFEDGELKSADGQMPTSPSSLFVFDLESHRLMFAQEHKGSPTISTFKGTLSSFLREAHYEFLKAKSKVEDPATGKKPTLKSLLKQYPKPKLKVVPISSQESMQHFVARFSKLQKLSIKLLDTNDELDNDEFMVSLRESQKQIKSKSTTLIHRNPSGLKHSEAVDQLTAVTKQGNHEVILTGKDSSGDTLKGDNDEFKILVPLSGIPLRMSFAARVFYNTMCELVSSGTIVIQKASQSTKAKVEAILKEFNEN